MKENTFKKVGIKNFIDENYKKIILGVFAIFAIYGKEIFSINVRVDTETVLNNPNHLNFITRGRQGALFTRLLFEQLNFNPYFAVLMALIILVFNMIFFGYLINYIGKIKFKHSLIMYLIFIIHPIWVEQFYFNLQILEISMGLFIIFVSVLTSYKGILENRKVYKLISIVLMIWAFSTYQLFMIMYISISIFCFIIFYRQQYLIKKEVDINILIKIIYQLIILFFGAVLLNGIITKAFFLSSNEYFEAQKNWDNLPISSCINNIILHIKSVIYGQGVFYSYSYIISLFFLFVFICYDLYSYKNSKIKFLYILSILGLQVCPFLLTIYCANTPVIRAQFILPFVIASNIIMFMISVSSMKRIKIAAYIIAGIVLITQIQTVMRLQYTDDIRFEEDMRIASEIFTEVKRVQDGKNKPVAFIGAKYLNLNAACIKGEMIGQSIFNHDAQRQPRYVYSSTRSANLCTAMGMPMKSASEDQIFKARKIAQEMSVWPQNNSIIDAGDYIIVKLSEDIGYYDDILEPKLEKIEIDNIQYNTDDNIEWHIDNNRLENDIIYIDGWMLNKNYSSENSLLNVYLKNENNGYIYKLSTIKQKRDDITKYINNGKNYDNSGYRSKGSYSDLNDKSSKYRILLSYENNGDISYINTGIFIN